MAELEAELSELRALLDEKTATVELLADDLKRYRYAYNVGQPHSPERVAKDQLQLAFERVLETLPPANDVPDAPSGGTSGSNVGGNATESPLPTGDTGSTPLKWTPSFGPKWGRAKV